jgi:plasmid stabilization system protein ParE
MTEVVISSAAELDYADGLTWYAERSARAAEGFETEFQRALESIAADPQRFPKCDERHRYFLMRRYPYQVIYRHVEDRLVVIAVAHAKRMPRYWSDR